MTCSELYSGVRRELGQGERYAHVVRVARLADRLAQKHGGDARRARLAGMLHDLARLYPKERILTECEQRAMPIDPFERSHPIVLHARLSAELARERFGVHDEVILSAIRKHTVADACMTRLDTIVYLADSLEPGRGFAERAALEALAFRDLELAMRAVLISSMAHLEREGKEVAPQTRAALEHVTPLHA